MQNKTFLISPILMGALALLATGCMEASSPVAPPTASESEPLLATALVTTTLYEAEKALVVGPKILASNAGYTGTGYADYQNASNDYVEFSVTAATAGTFTLVFRFAHGGTDTRYLNLSIGGVIVSKMKFTPTGGWAKWSTGTINSNLKAGVNKIRLTATGSNGPNLDNLSVTPYTPPSIPPSPPKVSIDVSRQNDNTPTWTWVSGGGGNGTYRYKVDNSDFTSGSVATTATTFTVPAPVANGIHYLAVEERNADGLWSAPGSTAINIIVNLPPYDAGQWAVNAVSSGPLRGTVEYIFDAPNGYLDFQNASNDYIEFSLTVPLDGVYNLDFHYANGGSTSRPLRVDVNGLTVNPALAFPATGAWANWSQVSMNAGLFKNRANTVRITAIGSSGGNFSSLQVHSLVPVPPAPEVFSPRSPAFNPVNFSWTSMDPNGSGAYRYCVTQNGTTGPWIGTEATGISLADMPAGNLDITVQEFDKYGYYGRSGSGSVVIADHGTAPIVNAPTGAFPIHFSWTSTQPGDFHYFHYKLHNDLAGWSSIGTNTSFDAFYALPGGTYSFDVEEQNAYGYWSPTGTVVFTVP